MPPRKSDRAHRLTGTYRPDRHGRTAAPPSPEESPLEPPATLTAGLAAIWRELSAGAPWLTAADRAALDLAVRGVAELRKGSPSAALLAAVGAALDRLGLSPKARGETTSIEPERAAAPERKGARYFDSPSSDGRR